MLNWRIEEEQYIKEKITQYRKKLSALALIFISEKQLNEKIKYITEQAKLEYRGEKLDKYLDEIKEERKRIDNVVKDLNNKIEKYAEETFIDKPAKIEAKCYDDLNTYPKQMETIYIEIKPFKVGFLQEKID